MSRNFLFSKVCWQCPAKFLPFHLKQTFLPIIWIFTEGDVIESRLPFKVFSTLKASTYIFLGSLLFKLYKKKNGENVTFCVQETMPKNVRITSKCYNNTKMILIDIWFVAQMLTNHLVEFMLTKGEAMLCGNHLVDLDLHPSGNSKFRLLC